MKRVKWFLSLILVFTILIIQSLFSQSPVPDGTTVDKIAGGYQFVEGPVWHSDGYLLFSDIPANTVYKWSEDGGSEVYLNPSGNSNGLMWDANHLLILAQHGNRRVARIEADATETALATHYEGKRLNSPNDLALKSDGSIFFTDPPWGINNNPGLRELDWDGIYRLNPDGKLYLLDETVAYPNGICFSPDESKLYVNDSGGRKIYVWDVVNDSTLANKQLFYSMPGSGSADGMKVDTEGNLYSTGPGAVWIFKPDGSLLDKIPVPETTANLNWGGPDNNELYITASSSIYRIKVNATGSSVLTVGASSWKPESIRLLPNYPNPFNPGTRIGFELDRAQYVSLSIHNVTGQEVATLFNHEWKNSGEHDLSFHADKLPGGMYFYRLTAESFVDTKRMVLLK